MIKTGSGGVCCRNARGRVRNRKSNPDGVAGGIWRAVRTILQINPTVSDESFTDEYLI